MGRARFAARVLRVVMERRRESDAMRRRRGPCEGPGMLFAPLSLRGLLFAAPANETMLAVRFHVQYHGSRYATFTKGLSVYDSIGDRLQSFVLGILPTLLPVAEEVSSSDADSIDDLISTVVRAGDLTQLMPAAWLSR